MERQVNLLELVGRQAVTIETLQGDLRLLQRQIEIGDKVRKELRDKLDAVLKPETPAKISDIREQDRGVG